MLRQLIAIDAARHYHIAEQQVDVRIRIQHFHRLERVFGGMHGITQPLQGFFHHLQQFNFIVHYQNGLVAAGHVILFVLINVRGSGIGCSLWQIQPDGGADSRLGIELDMPARAFYKTEHHRHTQPGALALLLGGKERFENTILQLWRYALAVIADRQLNIVTGASAGIDGAVGFIQRRVAGFDAEFAAAIHGVTRIQHQIQQRVFAITCVNFCQPQVLFQFVLYFHLRRQRAFYQSVHACNQAVDIANDVFATVLPGKPEQLACKVDSTLGGMVDGVDAFFCFFITIDLALKQTQVAQNDAQDIVEIMRDAAGKLADGFHLLRALQRLLGLLAFGNVTYLRQHQPLAIKLEQGC